MVNEKLIEISEKLNCEYIQENTVYEYVLNGDSFPVTNHYLKIKYKNSLIDARFEFGRQNICEIYVELELTKPKESFEIRTHSHLKRLFIKNNSPWKIKILDPVLKRNILKLFEISELNEIAKNTSFEPVVNGDNKENKYEIITRFSLAFENKEESILPMINMYKDLIDFLLK